MEVILRSDVEKLGLKGEVVDVKRGYARNFLLPRKLAYEATPARVKELEKVESHRARHEAKTFEDAQSVAEKLGTVELRYDVKAGPTGSLFGSVTPTDIADSVQFLGSRDGGEGGGGERQFVPANATAGNEDFAAGADDDIPF